MAFERSQHTCGVDVALLALGHSIERAASEPPAQAADSVRRALRRFIAASPIGPALAGAYGEMAAAVVPSRRAAPTPESDAAAPAWGHGPRSFRDSTTGLAWQMAHFRGALHVLGPSPSSTSVAQAHAFVAARSKNVPQAEVASYVHELRLGAQVQHAFVLRLMQARGAAVATQDGRDSLARALCGELERSLSEVHPAVRDLFVQNFKKKAHIAPLRLRPPA